MIEQPDLLGWKPPAPKFGSNFDGATFEPKRDGFRLSKQLQSVYNLMGDGKWRTLEQISDLIGAPMQSCSARMRDFKKNKFGGYQVERRYIRRGLFEYRLNVQSG